MLALQRGSQSWLDYQPRGFKTNLALLPGKVYLQASMVRMKSEDARDPQASRRQEANQKGVGGT